MRYCGRLLVLVGLALALAAPAQAAPGGLDSSFSGDGRVTTDFGREDFGGNVVRQPDGKIVTAGCTGCGAGSDIALARYLPDGTLDSSFGGDGRVTSDFGGSELARAVALQPDGRIVVGAVYSPEDSPEGYAVARYRPDGSLDPSFGDGGKVLRPSPTGVNLADLALQQDGKIVLVGDFNQMPNRFDFFVSRLAPDGSFVDGVTSDFSIFDTAAAVAIQPDGKIVLGGSSLVRYNPDLSLDESFGGDGAVLPGVFPIDLAIQPDGAIVTAGSDSDGGTDWDFALERYRADGTPDPSFSGDGRVTSDFGGRDLAFGLAIQPNLKIVVVGSTGASTTADFALARYLPDGALDSSFSGDGKTTTNFGGFDVASAVALQPDGKIVAAGSTTAGGDRDFALARYLGDPVALCDGRRPTIVGAGAIVGTPGDDVIVGSEGDDDISAGAGHDLVCARGGDDGVLGEAGNDVVRGGDGQDRLLDTGGGKDFLYGEGGDDTMAAGADTDRLEGGAGRDALDGAFGDDVLLGGDERDEIQGGDGADSLFGDAGDDALLGQLGNDVVRGGTGEDALFGDDGKDFLYGEAGDDSLDGRDDDDRVEGGDGNDSMDGGLGNDNMLGGNGGDEVRGGEGNDQLFGNADNDRLFGSTGNDRLDGGAGTDHGDGGPDADTAVSCETQTAIP